jgi:hypothetical protein
MPPFKGKHYDTSKRGHFYFGQRGHYHFGMTGNFLGKGLREKKRGGQERAREEVGEFFPVDTEGSLGVGLVGKMAAGQGNLEIRTG